MKNRKCAVCGVLLVVVLVMAAIAAKSGEKAFQPGKDGWVTLFDGSDLAKWNRGKGADWAIKDGVLAGSKGEILSYWHWIDFELVATCRGNGAIRCRLSSVATPAQPGYWLDLGDGTLRAAKGRVVAKGSGAKSDGWRQVRLVASKGRFTVHFDGKKVAEGADNTCPAMGKIGLVANGQRLQLKLLRVRPLNREQHINIPSPNSACYVCHANFEGEPISKTHMAEDVACAACHGPSLAHRSDEDNVTAPDVMFTRGEVDPACLKCHKRHKTMKKKKDGKGPPPANPICTDCHGVHKGRN
jgi:hypothetical protein